MTDKIKDIDVSEYKYFNKVTYEEPYCNIDEEHLYTCSSDENCYFKQLKRLQKENEELRQVRKNSHDIQEPYVYLYRQIKKQCYRLEEKIKSEKYIKENALQEATKYSMKCGEFRQALKEIREVLEYYANSWINPLQYPDLHYDNKKAKDALLKIDEVLKR